MPVVLIPTLCFFLWTVRKTEGDKAAESGGAPAPSSFSDIHGNPWLISGLIVFLLGFTFIVALVLWLRCFQAQRNELEHAVSALHHLYACDALSENVDAERQLFHELRLRRFRYCRFFVQENRYRVYLNGGTEWEDRVMMTHQS